MSSFIAPFCLTFFVISYFAFVIRDSFWSRFCITLFWKYFVSNAYFSTFLLTSIFIFDFSLCPIPFEAFFFPYFLHRNSNVTRRIRCSVKDIFCSSASFKRTNVALRSKRLFRFQQFVIKIPFESEKKVNIFFFLSDLVYDKMLNAILDLAIFFFFFFFGLDPRHKSIFIASDCFDQKWRFLFFFFFCLYLTNTEKGTK